MLTPNRKAFAQLMMSHHHKRRNPIECNDIGKKRLRQSRRLSTMEYSGNNSKFNNVKPYPCLVAICDTLHLMPGKRNKVFADTIRTPAGSKPDAKEEITDT